MEQIVYNFRANFAKDDNELGLTNLVEHNIDTSENAPIKRPAYQTTPAKLAEIKKQVQQMLDFDIIQPSKSNWSAPVVLVGKKDDTSLFCVDFRKLNAITQKNAFPLPLIDQILDCLEGTGFYSSLDVAAGYWQVPLTESANPKTAFSTPDGGHYEYKRLPFGLCNAPATFQRLMNQLFKEELYDFVTIFLDDFLIYSQNLEEHLQHLKIVMERLTSAGLKPKPSKCKLIQRAVSYLGYHIRADEIWPDEGKLSALSKWPEPTNTTEVESFVGFCSYYRRLVKNFAGIAKPSHELTKKHQRFYRNENCERSFEDLKNKLIGAPILSHPNYDRPFVLDTDASNNSITAVLSNLDSNTENPLAFVSRVLTRTEVNYSTTKREALAVVQAVKWFRSYLLGIPFILRTDHASLQWLFRQNGDGMTYRMIDVLQEFDFQVVHRPGEKHGNADALSCQTTREPEWQEGEEEAATGSCPEPTNLETAIAKLREPEVFLLSITEPSEENVASVELKASSDEVRAKQREDSAITTILQKAMVPLSDRQYNCSTFGVKPMTREHAQKLGPEVLGLWNNWEQ